jgi:hypothetical protein
MRLGLHNKVGINIQQIQARGVRFDSLKIELGILSCI